MNGSGSCRGGDHRAPQDGGSCPCGMVTRVPARRPAAPRRNDTGAAPDPADSNAVGLDTAALALLERCLREGTGALDPAASTLLRDRATRLLAALDLADGAPAAAEAAA
ncbi:hypothetical protein [Blastococcus sp. SYSU D00695]